MKPPVWRRVLVTGETMIGTLHEIVQIAMGWQNGHLCTFTVRGRDYGIAHEGGLGFEILGLQMLPASPAVPRGLPSRSDHVSWRPPWLRRKINTPFSEAEKEGPLPLCSGSAIGTGSPLNTAAPASNGCAISWPVRRNSRYAFPS